MRITVQEIRRNHFNKKMMGYDPVEVDAFLELCAQELELAQRESNEAKTKWQTLEQEVAEYRMRERTLQEALKSAQDTAEQITGQAKRTAELHLREAQLNIEQEKQKGMHELQRLQEETVKLQLQKDKFLRKLRHLLRAEEELLDIIAKEDNEE